MCAYLTNIVSKIYFVAFISNRKIENYLHSCHTVDSNLNNSNNACENVMTKFYVSDTVINLSDHHLTNAQTSLLSKGLKFCPTPGEPNQGDLWRDLQKYHRSLRRTAAINKFKVARPEKLNLTFEEALEYLEQNPIPIHFENMDNQTPFQNRKFKTESKWNPPGPKDLEHFIAKNELLLSQTVPKDCKIHNITQSECKAMSELKNLKNIIIKPADKGAACVVLNASDYKLEALRQLSNGKYYVKTHKDLTHKHSIEVNNLIGQMFENGEISKQTLDYLNLEPDSTRTARFYMLPKIHKNKIPPPGRPIVSGNGCPTEKISKFVDFFLNPLSKKFPSYVKDTNHFLQLLHNIKKVPNGSFLFTLDIESLYTNIKHSVGLKFIKAALEKLRPGHTNPSNSSLLKLLEAILTKNNFSFNDEHYLQIAGTAMGTKTAPSYANIVIAIFELLYVFTYPSKPLCWHRFIDDIFGIWTHGEEEFDNFVNHLNSRIEDLKFTSEKSYSKLSFLDTLVILNNNDTLSTSIYRKPTDTYNYILFNSAHPVSCKKGIPYGQFLRIRRICTNTKDFETHSSDMAKAFIERGYPPKLIHDSLEKARNLDRHTLLWPSKDIEKSKTNSEIFLIQTFHPGNNPLQTIVSQNWDYLQTNPHLKAFQDCKLTIANRRPPNLRNILTQASFTDHANQKTGKKNVCKMGTKCRYCPKIVKSGNITSKTTGRSYKTKTNVCCQSNNLIYCIECKTCGIQYVGETYRRIMDRFQGHFSIIRSNNPNINSLIRYHFNQHKHNGINDLKIYILDFIAMSPKTSRTKSFRLKIEQNWIHRLKTVFPSGLNLDT